MMNLSDIRAYEQFIVARQYSTSSSEEFGIDERDFIGSDPGTQAERYVTVVHEARPRERPYLVKPIAGSGTEWTVSRFFMPSGQSGHAISDELEWVKKGEEIRRRLQEAIAELATLSDGWAGEGSVAPSSRVMEDARRFASLLPERIPEPAVSAADDGEIVIEWAVADKRAVVGLEGDGSFGYALHFGGCYNAGSEEGDLSAKDIPSDLKSYLKAMKSL